MQIMSLSQVKLLGQLHLLAGSTKLIDESMRKTSGLHGEPSKLIDIVKYILNHKESTYYKTVRKKAESAKSPA